MKLLIALIVALGALSLTQSVTAQVASGRIVTVDLNKLFNEYYKTPVASAKLKDSAEGLNKENEQLITKYKKLVSDLDKLREEAEKPEYSAEVKEQKRKQVQEKLVEAQRTEKEIADFRRTNQQQLERDRERMRQNILKEITEVVNKEAKDAGYLYVFDKSGLTLNGVPSIVYAQDSLDITDAILKILNRNAPKTEAPKPEEKK